jgi:hypothetical protein
MIGREALPQAEAIVERYLSTTAGATQRGSVNKFGRFDKVIRNAAVGYREAFRLTDAGRSQRQPGVTRAANHAKAHPRRSLARPPAP